MINLRRLFIRAEPKTRLGPNTKKPVETTVKNNLDVTLLSLLLKEQLCGKELINRINDKFGVILGLSTVYPMLYELEKNKLIKRRIAGKQKVYFVPSDKRKAAKTLIKQRTELERELIRQVSGALL